MHPTPPTAQPGRPPRKKVSLVRARSVPFKRPYILALIVSALFYLNLIAASAALFAFIVHSNKNSASLLIGFSGFSAFLWLFSFFRRRSCICPLCKGTPYLDNSAHNHEKAVRFFPLNYGTSNVVCSLFRQHFRCQFCGTPYDLLKPVTKHHREPAAAEKPFTQPAYAPRPEPHHAAPVGSAIGGS